MAGRLFSGARAFWLVPLLTLIVTPLVLGMAWLLDRWLVPASGAVKLALIVGLLLLAVGLFVVWLRWMGGASRERRLGLPPLRHKPIHVERIRLVGWDGMAVRVLVYPDRVRWEVTGPTGPPVEIVALRDVVSVRTLASASMRDAFPDAIGGRRARYKGVELMLRDGGRRTLLAEDPEGLRRAIAALVRRP